MSPEQLVVSHLDRHLAPGSQPVLPPGRVTMRLIRRVHWRIYPFRVPKILTMLAVLGLFVWLVPATRDAARAGYAQLRADASAAIGQVRAHVRGRLWGSGRQAN
jgi:hypothetical protein